jgi:hypothetical protein
MFTETRAPLSKEEKAWMRGILSQDVVRFLSWICDILFLGLEKYSLGFER